jgi:RNA polymerase sigma-70 factor, ECF subfamily
MHETLRNASNLQDRELIIESQGGNHSAFETIVRKYRSHLTALLRWHAGPTGDIDDLMQRLLCKIYFSLKSFDTNRPFYPWLHRIAVNLCCDEKRRLRRWKTLTLAELELLEAGADTRLPVYIEDSYSAATNQEMSDMLQRVIKMLPETYQQVITLHHLKQMPYEEIAAILNCTPRAARIKAFRARAALRKLLEGPDPEERRWSSSSSISERLDACCRRNLIKSSRPYQVNSGIKEAPQAC